MPNAVYSATKAAVDAVARCLATELGPRDVRANSVDTGKVETDGVHPDAHDRHAINGTLLLALLKSHRGEPNEAERLPLGALERARTALGDRHEVTAAILSNLAVTLKQQGRPAEARPYSKECLATARLVFGEDHSRTLLAPFASVGRGSEFTPHGDRACSAHNAKPRAKERYWYSLAPTEPRP